MKCLMEAMRGVEAASELYFSKPFAVNLNEAAILAGLPQGLTYSLWR